MATYTLDWSETNLGGSAVVSYASGAVLDFTDKPAGATSALSLTANRGDSINVTIAEFTIEKLSGTSVMTFDYHTSSESGFDKLHIDVDGVSQANFSGTTAWTSHAGINITGGAGTRTIRFRYQKDGGGLGGSDRVWVALLNITNTVTTNDDAGTTDDYDMEDGNVPSVATTSTWTNSTSEPITGSRSLRSPATTAGSGSYDLDITKPATTGYRPVGFDWKVSSEAGWDKLYVFPDSGAANVPASGHPTSVANPGWLEFSGTANGRFAVILPAASSTLRLRYAKDGSGDVGSDAAWIDTLRVGDEGGGTVTGVASAALTVTATAAGVPETFGVGAASLSVAATGAGIDRALGQAASALSIDGTAAGTPTVLGAASAALAVTASASGTIGSEPVTGSASAVLGVTAAASGTTTVLGAASSSLALAAAADGVDRAVGTAATTLVVTATASAVDRSLGVAVATLTVTATASGTSETPAVTGTAAAVLVVTATTIGQRRVIGVASATLGATGATVGVVLSNTTYTLTSTAAPSAFTSAAAGSAHTSSASPPAHTSRST